MKKIGSLLIMFFTAILIVKAEYYENHTMKIRYDNWMNYAFSDTYKVDESYIYTEFSDSADGNVNEYLNIIKSDIHGEKVWTKTFENVPHTYHNILVDGENILFISDTIGLKNLSIKDGSVKYEDTTLLGEDIKKINDNYIILASDKITIIDKNYKVKYELKVSDLTSLESASLFVEFEVSDSNIYILAYNVDAESNTKPVLITTNTELKNSTIVELTYDENQGFLSENNYFQDIKEFAMINDNLYQVGFDVYKISLDGTTTLIHDSEEKEIDCFDIIEYNNKIVTVEGEWTENNGYASVTIRNYDFQSEEILYPKKNNTKNSWGTAKNITLNGNDFVVKWMETNYGKFYVTEYSTEENYYLNPAGTASCEVISGTGMEIGDEIKCGTEYFYIIDANEEEVTMLAKYNLYVGDIYEEVIFEQIFSTQSEAINFYNENYALNYDGYEHALARTNSETNTIEYYGVLAHRLIEYDVVKQDETAIGAHGDEAGNPDFPEIGVVDFNDWPNVDKYYEPYESGFIDFVLSSYTDSYYYLKEYETYLNSMGVHTQYVTNITLSQISNLVEIVGGESLPLYEWYEARWEYGGLHSNFLLGSMVNYIPNEYKWIYSTTYWTNTCMTTTDDSNYCTSYAYFVDTLGNVCYEYWCEEAVGAGIRPLVTIPVSELKYQVITKTDGNGTIKTNTVLAPSGELIEFTVTPNEGYKIEKITVTDSDGKIVTFTSNTFTMPDADVIIEVTFVTDNPDTSDFAIYVAISLVLGGIFIMIHNKKKLNWLDK